MDVRFPAVCIRSKQYEAIATIIDLVCLCQSALALACWLEDAFAQDHLLDGPMHDRDPHALRESVTPDLGHGTMYCTDGTVQYISAS